MPCGISLSVTRSNRINELKRIMKEKTFTLIILHIAVFLAGWTGIFGRLISLSGLPLVWYRMIISVVVLFVMLAAMRRLHRTAMRAILKICGCGILLALHWVAFFASIQASNVSIGVACVATSCFFTTVFDPIVNRKRLQWKNVMLSFIAITGILFIFSIDVRYRLGIALGLSCAALYSLFSILNINVAKETNEDSATMLMYELLGGVLFLTLCIPIYTAIYPDVPIVPEKNDLLSLLLLGSIFTLIPFLFQLKALLKLSAFTINIAYNLEPLYSIAIAAVLFGELQEVGFSFWVGILLIVLSVVLQTYSIVSTSSSERRTE